MGGRPSPAGNTLHFHSPLAATDATFYSFQKHAQSSPKINLRDESTYDSDGARMRIDMIRRIAWIDSFAVDKPKAVFHLNAAVRFAR